MKRVVAVILAFSMMLDACSVMTRPPRSRAIAKGDQGILLSGAEAAPDLARGELAARNGRLDDARRDLEPLAGRGYVAAQLVLGRLYTHLDPPDWTASVKWFRAAYAQNAGLAEVALGRALMHQNDEEQLREANRLLTHAYDVRGDIDAQAGLINLYTDYPTLDVRSRIAELVSRAEADDYPETVSAVINWYRNTPALDGHPAKLARLCRRYLKQVPECYIDLVRDYRAGNDVGSLEPLVHQALDQYRAKAPPATDLSADTPGWLTPRLMAGVAHALVEQEETPKTANPALANEVLNRMFADPVPEATVQAAMVVVEFPFLAGDKDIEQMLKAALENGAGDAPLALGRLYMQGQRAPRDPAQAEHYLTVAAHAPPTATLGHYFLGRLYQFGYLDEIDPKKALEHLLIAARSGYPSADSALTRLFLNGDGVKIDVVDAYVFGRLAVRGGEKLFVDDVRQTLVQNQIHVELHFSRVVNLNQVQNRAQVRKPDAPRADKTIPNAAQSQEEIKTTEMMQWFRSKLTSEELRAADIRYREELSSRSGLRRRSAMQRARSDVDSPGDES